MTTHVSKSDAYAKVRAARASSKVPSRAKRHQNQKPIVTELNSMKKPSLQRVARRAGVAQFSADAFPAMRAYVTRVIQTAVKNAKALQKYRKRATVQGADARFALELMGIALVGKAATRDRKKKLAQ